MPEHGGRNGVRRAAEQRQRRNKPNTHINTRPTNITTAIVIISDDEDASADNDYTCVTTSDACNDKRSIEVQTVQHTSRPRDELRGTGNALEGQQTSTENLKRSVSPQQALFEGVQVERTTSDPGSSAHVETPIELVRGDLIRRLESVEKELKPAKEKLTSALQHLESAKETVKHERATVKDLESNICKIRNLMDHLQAGGKRKTRATGPFPSGKRKRSSTIPTGAALTPLPTSAIEPQSMKAELTTERNLNKYVIHRSAESKWKDDLKRLETIACQCKAKSGCDKRCSNKENNVACTYRTCCLTSAQCGNRWFDQMPKLEDSLSIKVDAIYGKALVWNGRQPLPPGTKIVRYLGEVISPKEVNKRNKTRDPITQGFYFFEFQESKLVVDATIHGNFAKYANHSCNPNCKVVTYHIDGELTFVYEARQEIASGDPITIHYRCAPTFIRLEIGEDAQDVKLCYCGYKKCAWKPSKAIQEADTWIRNQLSQGIMSVPAPTSLILKVRNGDGKVAIRHHDSHHEAASEAAKEATDWLREKLEPVMASENSWGPGMGGNSM